MSDNTIRDKVAAAIKSSIHDGRTPFTPYEVVADAAIAAHLQALTEAGYVLVKLPEPGEYKDGRSQWNWFPFVRLSGGSGPDRIGLGAKSEHIYWINRHEARAVAAALLAAANTVEAQS